MKATGIVRRIDACGIITQNEEDGVLYPIEIKMSGNPKAEMGATNQVLDRVQEKTRGMGVILCLIDKKTYLRENLVVLPIEYI